MKKLNIYLDTSVIGGCLDSEFEKYSNKIIQDILIGKHIGIVSKLTLAELIEAPDEVKSVMDRLLLINIKVVQEDEESSHLAKLYLDAKILSKKFLNDAIHIALATVNSADLLVSWNFKHVVHWDKIRKFNAINLMEGYSPLDIRSPLEVIEYEN